MNGLFDRDQTGVHGGVKGAIEPEPLDDLGECGRWAAGQPGMPGRGKRVVMYGVA